jgi:hypothetical protein
VAYGWPVTDVVERYLTLGLRLGRHVDGFVDAYYGPEELKAAVEEDELGSPEALRDEAAALERDLARAGLEPNREAWLGDQVRGIRVAAGVLAGEALSYSDEVEGCFGVRPDEWSDDVYEAAHERLDELLPPGESLLERYEGWRESRAVPAAKMVPALLAVIDALRTRAARLVDLPEGEELLVEEVHDEPWWAFNYYLGRLRSRVVVNSDTTTTASDIVTLASHEVYPGHHTERVVKEQQLVDRRGWLEETLLLVPTPQSVVCEGIAEAGLDVILDDGLREELEAALVAQGLKPELELALKVSQARRPIRRVGLDVALLVHEHDASPEEAKAHYERWALSRPDRAAQSLRFVTDPTWRSYVICYSAGVELCGRYAAGDPGRFRTLLTEQIRVADLLAAG